MEGYGRCGRRHELLDSADAAEADIVCVNEINGNTRMDSVREELKGAVHKHWINGVVTSSTTPAPGEQKWKQIGGTASIIRDNTVGRLCESIQTLYEP